MTMRSERTWMRKARYKERVIVGCICKIEAGGSMRAYARMREVGLGRGKRRSFEDGDDEETTNTLCIQRTEIEV